MNLFLNAVSSKGVIILFGNDKKIISRQDLNVAGNESEILIDLLDKFLKENKLGYKDLENLVVVAGPGSFTGVRTIVLMVNTINFVINKNITSVNYFDLFDSFPIIKASSRRDSFFKKDKNSQIVIIKNNDILNYLQEKNITELYGENKHLLLTEGFNPLNSWDNIKILENIDYHTIIKNIIFKKDKQIKPYYVKKPSIS